ncbi:MAG: hypothetical protein J2O48_05275 [Solirubrobacterales bacterium]|nr:hypothetical protein [Solirubrobacterales bacterium]
MTQHTFARPFRAFRRAALLSAAITTVAAPTALASSGGTGIDGTSTGTTTSSSDTSTTGTSTTGTSTTSTSGSTTSTPSSSTPVSASGNGFTLSSHATGTYGKTISFTGTAPSSAAGSRVVIERKSGSSWSQVAHGTVQSNGAFTVQWRANASGASSFRAGLANDATNASRTSHSSSSQGASPALSVTVFKNSIATYYGPGFYGHKTACGQTLSSSTIGVASRSLKCGTKVAFNYHGRTVTAPVIDRGPYANNASWDLTTALAKSLGIAQTVTLGSAAL